MSARRGVEREKGREKKREGKEKEKRWREMGSSETKNEMGKWSEKGNGRHQPVKDGWMDGRLLGLVTGGARDETVEKEKEKKMKNGGKNLK